MSPAAIKEQVRKRLASVQRLGPKAKETLDGGPMWTNILARLAIGSRAIELAGIQPILIGLVRNE